MGRERSHIPRFPRQASWPLTQSGTLILGNPQQVFSVLYNSENPIFLSDFLKHLAYTIKLKSLQTHYIINIRNEQMIFINQMDLKIKYNTKNMIGTLFFKKDWIIVFVLTHCQVIRQGT